MNADKKISVIGVNLRPIPFFRRFLMTIPNQIADLPLLAGIKLTDKVAIITGGGEQASEQIFVGTDLHWRSPFTGCRAWEFWAAIAASVRSC